MDKIRVAVIGANGYTGFMLLRLLAAHKHADVAYVTSRSGQICLGIISRARRRISAA